MGGDDATSAALASADALYASGDVAAALDVYAEVFRLRESPPANVLRERLASSSSSSSSTSLLNASRCVKRVAPADVSTAEALLRAAAASNDAGDAGAVAAADAELALLLCQEGRDDDARAILARRGFRYRLSREVLRYDREEDEEDEKDDVAEAIATHSKHVRVFDDAVPVAMLRRLREAFRPSSSFWREHAYGRSDCGFFSYVHELPPIGDGTTEPPPLNVMDVVVRHAWRIARLAFPACATATRAEWWAHARPHACGHQMHFDSDDEGARASRGGKNDAIRHPICSVVIFVNGRSGGPTLVTDQTPSSRRLARRGWLAAPKARSVTLAPVPYTRPRRGLFFSSLPARRARGVFLSAQRVSHAHNPDAHASTPLVDAV
jgi:hypothetical protein